MSGRGDGKGSAPTGSAAPWGLAWDGGSQGGVRAALGRHRALGSRQLSPSPAHRLFCRAIGLPSGIILFLLAKREVDKNRLEQLKIRRKMMEANQGEYESERYRRVARGA